MKHVHAEILLLYKRYLSNDHVQLRTYTVWNFHMPHVFTSYMDDVMHIFSWLPYAPMLLTCCSDVFT